MALCLLKRGKWWRADSTKPNMGLTTWKNAPQGRIRKSDVSIAKNYLNEDILHDKGKVTASDFIVISVGPLYQVYRSYTNSCRTISSVRLRMLSLKSI